MPSCQGKFPRERGLPPVPPGHCRSGRLLGIPCPFQRAQGPWGQEGLPCFLSTNPSTCLEEGLWAAAGRAWRAGMRPGEGLRAVSLAPVAKKLSFCLCEGHGIATEMKLGTKWESALCPWKCCCRGTARWSCDFSGQQIQAAHLHLRHTGWKVRNWGEMPFRREPWVPASERALSSGPGDPAAGPGKEAWAWGSRKGTRPAISLDGQNLTPGALRCCRTLPAGLPSVHSIPILSWVPRDPAWPSSLSQQQS